MKDSFYQISVVDCTDYYVREALDKWEPRITVVAVDVLERDDNVVPIVVTFVLANTNKSHSYVYPLNISIHNLGGGATYDY